MARKLSRFLALRLNCSGSRTRTDSLEIHSRVALRFEFYGDGIELANGFQELGHAGQQRERFIADNAERLHRGLPTRSLDEHLLAALEHGLPPSAGVAVGFDRLLMVASGAEHIRDVMTFTTEHA